MRAEIGGSSIPRVMRALVPTSREVAEHVGPHSNGDTVTDHKVS